MGNLGAEGRFVDTTGAPLAGLKVHVRALQFGRIGDLRWGVTDAAGRFSVAYAEHRRPVRLVVELYLPGGGRLIGFTPSSERTTDTVYSFGDIQVHRSHVQGWLVTLATLDPTSGAATMLSHGNRLETYIDNEDAWDQLHRAVRNADSRILWTPFYLQGYLHHELFTRFQAPPTGPPVWRRTGQRIHEDVRHAAMRGVDVSVLINDFVPDLCLGDSAVYTRTYFGPSSVDVENYPTPPPAPLHAKLVIVDDREAHSVGSPLLQEYMDDRHHLIWQPTRGVMVSPWNQIKRPIHDVGAKVEGPAVGHLEETFATLWQAAGGSPMSTATPPAEATGASVQVARTLWGPGLPSHPHGETGILEAYQRAIAEAQSWVYLENQYLTSEALKRALAHAITDPSRPDLEVIILINNSVDIPGYGQLQGRLLADLQQVLASAPTPMPGRRSARDRFGVFTLWSHEQYDGLDLVIANYVHSKVAAVDDRWATVGSANLDGASLNAMQWSTEDWQALVGRTIVGVGTPIAQHAVPVASLQAARGTEVNLVVYSDVPTNDGSARLPAAPVVADLRRELWAEHLGIGSAAWVDGDIRTAGSPLRLWRSLARAKRDRLDAGGRVHPCRVLESDFSLSFWTRAEPADHLRACVGITRDIVQLPCVADFPPSSPPSPAPIYVAASVSNFDLRTGRWQPGHGPPP